MTREAFGEGSLFADAVVSAPALFKRVPVGPADVGIPGLVDVLRSAFCAAEPVPLRGLRRGNTNMCCAFCAAQVMMWTPGILEWLQQHNPHVVVTTERV